MNGIRIKRSLKDMLITAAILAPAYILASVLSDRQELAVVVAGCCLFLLAGIALMGSIYGVVRAVISRAGGFNVKKQTRKIRRYIKKCNENIEREIRKIKLIHGFDRGYLALILVIIFLAVSSLVATGNLYTAIALTFACYFIIKYYDCNAVPDEEPGIYIDEEMHPKIYSLIGEVLSRHFPDVKYGDDIYCFVVHGPSISTLRWRRSYAVCIGTTAIGLMSESQLCATILHAFCEIKKGNCDIIHDAHELRRRYSTPSTRSILGGIMMFLPRMLSRERIPLFIGSSEKALDIRADKLAASMCDAEEKRSLIGGAALSKAIDHYLWEINTDGCLYKGETPPYSFESDFQNGFRKAFPERCDFWNELTEREIEGKDAPRLLFAHRREIFGIGKNDFDVLCDDVSYPYQVDRDSAIRRADEVIYEGMSEQYEEHRKNRYLAPYEFYNKYLDMVANGETPSLAVLVDSAFALECIDEIDEAAKMYDEILKTYPDNPNALFRRGLIHIHSYEEKGIDMMIRAMRGNSNFIDNGLPAVHSFCQRMGLSNRLAEIEDISPELLDYRINKYSPATRINRKDRFLPVDLSKDLVEEILNEIIKQCEDMLDSVYMVRKCTKDINATFIFIRLVKGYDPSQWEEAYQNLFTFLDVKEEDFVLDTLDGEPEYLGKISKVSGALLYKKKHKTEE